MPKQIMLAAILSMGALLLTACDESTSKVHVVTASTESSGNEAAVALFDAGIDDVRLSCEKNGRNREWRIYVPRDKAMIARKVLVDRGLPREEKPTRAALFREGGVMPNERNDHERRVAANQGEIERMLEAHDRVIGARIVLSIPHSDPLRRDAACKPSATVTLRYSVIESAAEESPGAGDAVPNTAPPLLESRVKELVARAVDGLTPDAVEVSFEPVRITAIRAVAASAKSVASGDALPTNVRVLWGLLALSAALGASVVFLLVKLTRSRSAGDAVEPLEAAA